MPSSQPELIENRVEPPGLRVFISYSRKDETFTRWLAAALAERGFAPDFDQAATDPDRIDTGISAEDEWWQRLQVMIANADAIVFVVSPASAASSVCDEEIAYSRGLGKRIIPLLRSSVDFAKVPPRLSALNVRLDFTSEATADLDSALDELCTALSRDVGWYRESRRLTSLAARWDAAARPEAMLLTLADVEAVGRLLEKRPATAPEPASALVELRDASRTRLDQDNRRLRRMIGRAFVKPAQAAVDQGRYENALRLAATGALLSEDLDFAVLPELWAPAASAIMSCRTRRLYKDVAIISPNATRFARQAGADTEIVDVLTGELISRLAGVRLGRAIFSPDGRRLVVERDMLSVLTTWDVALACKVSEVRGLNFLVSPDGSKLLTTVQDNDVWLWDIESGRYLVKLKGCSRSYAAAFSPDGKRIITQSESGAPHIWNAETGHIVIRLEGGKLQPRSASFSPDGSAALCVAGTEVHVWNAVTGKNHRRLSGHAKSVFCACFSPDGRLILTASDDHTARVWNAADGTELLALEGHTAQVAAAGFDPRGTRVITGSSDCTVRLWDAATGEQLLSYSEHDKYVAEVRFTSDGRHVVSLCGDGVVRIWDAASSNRIAVFPGGAMGVVKVSTSADGRSVAGGLADQSALVWKNTTGAAVPLPPPVNDISLDHDASRAVTASTSGLARISELKSEGRTVEFTNGSGRRAKAVFTADGGSIVTEAAHVPPALWSASNGERLATFEGQNRWSLSRDGKIVVTSDNKSATAWSSQNGRQLMQVSGLVTGPEMVWIGLEGRRMLVRTVEELHEVEGDSHRVHPLPSTYAIRDKASPRDITQKDVSNDYRLGALAFDDRTIRLMDFERGACFGLMRAPPTAGACYGLQLSTDGRTLTATFENKTTMAWDVSRALIALNERAVALTAALAGGVGLRAKADAEDLVMQDAPEDIHAALLSHLSARRDAVDIATKELRKPFHDWCYLSPAASTKTIGSSPPQVEADAKLSAAGKPRAWLRGVAVLLLAGLVLALLAYSSDWFGALALEMTSALRGR